MIATCRKRLYALKVCSRKSNNTTSLTHAMSASLNLIDPAKPKRIALIAANASTSKQTGWPIGFWWAELTHPYWEFTEKGYKLVVAFHEAKKVVAIVCHATCILLKAKTADGKLLVDGRTWTGFADAEEQFADTFVGQRIQPFWIETEARKLPNTNFITGGMFKAFAVRDGRLITGQQQFSGAATARMVIEALGA